MLKETRCLISNYINSATLLCCTSFCMNAYTAIIPYKVTVPEDHMAIFENQGSFYETIYLPGPTLHGQMMSCIYFQ